MIDFTYSTRGRTCEGRWYPRPDRISIFLNKVKDTSHPDEDFLGFIAHICAIEFHELGHIYGWRGGCNSIKCAEGECWWCNYTDRLQYDLHTDLLMDDLGMQKPIWEIWSDFFTSNFGDPTP